MLAAFSSVAVVISFIQWLDERRWKREMEAEKAAAKHTAE
jgi:hypothetical protein